MVIQITDSLDLLRELSSEYRDGIAWLTVPGAARAVGPLPYPDYLAHQTGQHTHPDLRELAARQGQRDRLPPTGIPVQAEPEVGSGTS